MIYLIALPFLFASNIQAQAISTEELHRNLCLPNNFSFDAEWNLSAPPDYFFKISPDGKTIGWIGPSGNNLLDTQTGKQFKFPGPFDVVFSPDGSMICTPETVEKTNWGSMQCFDGKKSKEEFGGKHPPKVSDLYGLDELPSSALNMNGAPIEGVYQTIGKTGKNQYTIITDHDGLTLYHNAQDGLGNLELISSQPPCPEGVDGNELRNIDISLPVISKDGKYLSYLNDQTNTTKIIRLDGKSCHEVLDLGFPAGKTDFDFKNNQIAFHLTQYDPLRAQSYSMYNDSTIAQDVFVMKVERLGRGDSETWNPTDIARLTRHTRPDEGSYYPAFDERGNVYMLNRDLGDERFYISMTKKENLPFIPYGDYAPLSLIDPSATPCVVPENPLLNTIIGQLFSEFCDMNSHGTLLAHELRFFASNLDEEECLDLVQAQTSELILKTYKEDPFQYRYIFDSQTGILPAISVEDLSYFCLNHSSREQEHRVLPLPPLPEMVPTAEPDLASVFGGIDPFKDHSNQVGKDLFIDRCLICHRGAYSSAQGGALPAFTETGKITPDIKARMINQVASGRMPLGGGITSEEREQIIEYLKNELGQE